jgi:hypothetical protein
MAKASLSLLTIASACPVLCDHARFQGANTSLRNLPIAWISASPGT